MLIRKFQDSPRQEDENIGEQIIAECPEPGEGGDCGSTDRRVLKDDAVVDVPDVAGRVGGAGSLQAQQVQDPHGQARVLTILNELAEVSKTCNERKLNTINIFKREKDSN